jgi:hypothetical protein
MALLLAEGGFAAEAMPALDECLALAASARSLIAGDAETERAVAAEPPAPQSLTDVAGAIGCLLGDIRRSLQKDYYRLIYCARGMALTAILFQGPPT